MKGSKLSIRRVTTGEVYAIEFRWNVSRKQDTYGQRVCNAFVDGSKVGSTMGGGYDLPRDAMISWLTGKVRDDDYGDWLRWGIPTDDHGLYPGDYTMSRTDTHTVPEIRTGRTLASLLWCLGFEIVMDKHGQPGAGVEAARGDGHGR